MGAWFEAQVTKVTVKNASNEDSSSSSSDATYLYHVTFDE